MWSKNRFIDLVMNVLLFMHGINVFHYGQFLLPIMCLILFADRKMKFYVREPKVFILLCLFAISFYAFSYQLGFYSVMGFCMPMAYYVGSNLLEVNEENIKKVMYYVSFGMCAHLILNFAYDCTILGNEVMTRNTHYDFWTKGYVASNSTSVNMVPIFSFIYYLMVFEKDKRFKYTGIVLFITSMFYELCLGKRMPAFILVLCIVFCVLYDLIFINKNKKAILILVVPAVILTSIIVMYMTNMFGIRVVMDNIRLVIKIKAGFFDFDRLNILIAALPYLSKHMWGGRKITSELGIMIHELWLDVYDYAGIITYLLLVAYTVYYVCCLFKFLKSEKVSKPFKLFFASFVFCAAFVMFLEPVMTGSSLFLIFVIMAGTLVSCLI